MNDSSVCVLQLVRNTSTNCVSEGLKCCELSRGCQSCWHLRLTHTYVWRTHEDVAQYPASCSCSRYRLCLSLPVCLISYLKLLWKELPVTFADDIFLETLSIPIKQILLKHCRLHIRDISALVSVCFHYVWNLTCFVEIFLINIYR